MPHLSKRLALQALFALGAVGAVAFALRVIVNSSTFQPFGNWVARVDTTDRVVALTFDDGPNPIHTPKVLDVLDQYKVKATFFMMGVNVERFPDVAREVVRRGHEVGNHSYSHPKLILMSAARVREEIERTDALLRRVGVVGEIPFRPPHSAKFIVLPYVLMQMNKLSVLGDVDPREWKNPPAAAIAESVLKQVRPGSIVGLHDPGGPETLHALERILPALTSQGYRIETVAGLMRYRTTKH